MWTIFQKTAVKEPHPLDEKYGLLNCRLTLVDKKAKEYKVVALSIFCVMTVFL